MSENSRARVARLLGIVAYLEDNGATGFEELADHFSVTSAQIAKDIEQLWIVGRPGGFANDLIDFDYDSFDAGVAKITNTQGATQVRLAPREGVALVAALSAIVGAGVAPRAAESALAKITEALGEETVTVLGTPDASSKVVQTLAIAVQQGVVARLDYIDAADRRTQRDVEPHRIVTIDGAPYLECWCRRAGDYRTLRIDRIVSAKVTDDEVVTPASGSEGFSLARQYEATVTLRRGGRWVLEDIPGVQLSDDGELVTATLGVTNEPWFAGRLLSIATSLISVEPESLRREVTRQAQSVAAVHGE
ncbi:helix-turn-helix transcriptional regulator [Demequina sp.]|uniref:helix-turn-helix transcriptional regulator n=1 Tax=Demequina sp. TaxID=2050685 RepID=UPI003D0C0482